MMIRTVATVGAGQVAAVVARTLRRRGFDGRIVLIGDEQHAPYQRPPLSKEFLAGREPVESLALLTPQWLTDNKVELRIGTAVRRLDRSGRTIELETGEHLDVDAAVFATGGRPRTLQTIGTRPDLVHYLRTIDDAMVLTQRLTPGARLIIIGGGFIGLEIASTAIGLGVHVTVLERGATPLLRVLGEQMSALCTRLHLERGVNVQTSADVTEVHTSDAGARVTLSNGDVLEADAVVVGIGIDPNTDVATASGLRTAGGIMVDASGRTGTPNVFAAGDVACRMSAAGPVRVEHFDNANRQAGVVANAILGRDTSADDPHWFWSDQYGMNIQLTGSTSGATDLILRGDPGAGEFTAFYLSEGRLQAAFAIDRGEDIMAARELIGRTVDSRVLCDEDVDLWELGEQVAN